MKAWPYDSSWYPRVDNWQLLYSSMSALEDLDLSEHSRSEKINKLIAEANEEREFLSKIFFYKVDVRGARGLELRGTLLNDFNKINTLGREIIFSNSDRSIVPDNDSLPFTIKTPIRSLWFYKKETFVEIYGGSYLRLLTSRDRVILREYNPQLIEDELQLGYTSYGFLCENAPDSLT